MQISLKPSMLSMEGAGYANIIFLSSRALQLAKLYFGSGQHLHRVVGRYHDCFLFLFCQTTQLSTSHSGPYTLCVLGFGI